MCGFALIYYKQDVSLEFTLTIKLICAPTQN